LIEKNALITIASGVDFFLHTKNNTRTCNEKERWCYGDPNIVFVYLKTKILEVVINQKFRL
jgi:hypothetical protein